MLATLSNIDFLLALICFALAAHRDWPASTSYQTVNDKKWGNFWCSLGFLMLTAALWSSHA